MAYVSSPESNQDGFFIFVSQNGEQPVFEEIRSNIYLIDKHRSKLKGHSRLRCECTVNSDDPTWVGCGEGCINRAIMVECDKCQLNDFCTNRNFQKGCPWKLEVYKTDFKGWGLRTTQDIPKGSFILEYVGEVVSRDDAFSRSHRYRKEGVKMDYLMFLKTNEYIDATRKGGVARFMNHSCDPNCETMKWTVRGYLRIGIFSVRNIAAGDELCFNYQMDRFGGEAEICYCGASSCVGYLGTIKPKKWASDGAEDSLDHKKKKSKVKTTAVESSADYFESSIVKVIGRDTVITDEKKMIAFMGRLMLQEEDDEHRQTLLKILQNCDKTILKTFLAYKGLSLLWSWMIEAEPASDKFKIELLKTLRHLPISTYYQVYDAKVYDAVAKWCRKLSELGSSDETDYPATQTAIDFPPGDTGPGLGSNDDESVSRDDLPVLSTRGETPLSKSVCGEASVDTSLATDLVSVRDDSLESGIGLAPSQAMLLSNDSSILEKSELLCLVTDVLEAWSSLPRPYRIPRKVLSIQENKTAQSQLAATVGAEGTVTDTRSGKPPKKAKRSKKTKSRSLHPCATPNIPSECVEAEIAASTEKSPLIVGSKMATGTMIKTVQVLRTGYKSRWEPRDVDATMPSEALDTRSNSSEPQGASVLSTSPPHGSNASHTRTNQSDPVEDQLRQLRGLKTSTSNGATTVMPEAWFNSCPPMQGSYLGSDDLQGSRSNMNGGSLAPRNAHGPNNSCTWKSAPPWPLELFTPPTAGFGLDSLPRPSCSSMPITTSMVHPWQPAATSHFPVQPPSQRTMLHGTPGLLNPDYCPFPGPPPISHFPIPPPSVLPPPCATAVHPPPVIGLMGGYPSRISNTGPIHAVPASNFDNLTDLIMGARRASSTSCSQWESSSSHSRVEPVSPPFCLPPQQVLQVLLSQTSNPNAQTSPHVQVQPSAATPATSQLLPLPMVIQPAMAMLGGPVTLTQPPLQTPVSSTGPPGRTFVRNPLEECSRSVCATHHTPSPDTSSKEGHNGNPQPAMSDVSSPSYQEDSESYSDSPCQSLPPNWRTATDPHGRVYYYHAVTRQTQWEPPPSSSIPLNVRSTQSSQHLQHKPQRLTPVQGHSTGEPGGGNSRSTLTPSRTPPSPSKGRQPDGQRDGDPTGVDPMVTFKHRLGPLVVSILNKYRHGEYPFGKINSDEDFKFLARKLTHGLLQKETNRVGSVRKLNYNERVKRRAKEFIHQYMRRSGTCFVRG